MKILLLNTYDITGGAARATYRLHEALLRGGVDSRMLVAYKSGAADSVITAASALSARGKFMYKTGLAVRRFADRLPVRKYPLMKNSAWGPFTPAIVRNKKLVDTINAIGPDIVHLCWICDGMIAVEDLARIKAPIVWRLPDMWAFTGGCHYAAGEMSSDAMCDGYARECGVCGVLGSDNDDDLSRRVFNRKKKTFAKIPDMTIVGVSEWLAACAGKSALFAGRKIVCLPNPIDTNVFKPIDRRASRAMWNLPEDKKLILFGAVSATSTPYKGYDLLVDALRKISTPGIECVIFGADGSKDHVVGELPCKIRYLGHLNDDVSLASLYGACDVTVVPSRREAFGQTASESLACGTPVAAFGIGGLLDIVDHKKNGYLAKPFDTSDLAAGINWILGDDDHCRLSRNSREKAVREYDYDVVAGKYAGLYGEVMKNA